MGTDERRKSQRVDSPNLLAYICLDENNNEIIQGMGRTLNVSEGGILLETHVPLDPQYIVRLTIGMEDDLVHFKGHIAHHREREDGKFESGIEFMEMNEHTRRFLRQYITIFEDQERTV
ncbi:MAG: PilZ domain-containing protein [Desulfobacterales bacterium]|nr:PilZ domain-containing protein [Desulfobacterales bacterium]